MRKPIHALQGAPVLTVTVFEKGKRHGLFEATGTDPSHIAQTVAAHDALTDSERPQIRTELRKALDGMRQKVIPSLVGSTLDIGGRRLRIRQAA